MADDPKPDEPREQTRFFILETTDDGETWEFVGSLLARNRDHAARLFYAGAGDRTVTYAAVSEAAWKPATRKPKVVASAEFAEFAMPLAPPPAELPVEAVVETLPLDPDVVS